MTVVPLNRWSESDQSAIREQLDRVLKSGPFHQSHRRQRFLGYLVNETLAGRGERLKAYTIAVEVFERPQSFDPLVDPLVRVEAAACGRSFASTMTRTANTILFALTSPRAPTCRISTCGRRQRSTRLHVPFQTSRKLKTLRGWRVPIAGSSSGCLQRPCL